ncbi:MAG: CoA ester lyase [Chloroflexi bacterium]|nr:CoA ester lyase [Chloroflexota bacterium]
MGALPLIRSWLYAPGNNPKLLERVFSAGADAVILDLEDSVPPAEKERARALVAEAVRARQGQRGPLVFVRINHPETGLAEDDLRAVVHAGLNGLRLPKVEDAETVRQIEACVQSAAARNGLPSAELPLMCNVESARGVWRAIEIALAHPSVTALAFGVVDFARDVNAIVGPEGLETLYARSQLVIASRVAGIRPPIDSVYAKLQDEAGLEHTTRQGRALGFFGRSAIHPRQVAIINTVFTPSQEEIGRARAVVDAAMRAEATGSGALRLPDGDFVDVAVVRRARDVLHLVEALGTASTG